LRRRGPRCRPSQSAVEANVVTEGDGRLRISYEQFEGCNLIHVYGVVGGARDRC
jgi:hypothetical protein